MAYPWELEEEVFEQIETKVKNHISEKYPEKKLGFEYLIERSVETYPPEVKFEFGWIIFFKNKIIYLKSVWRSEGSSLKNMEIEETWKVEGISDYVDLKFDIERTDETVELIMRYKDIEKKISSSLQGRDCSAGQNDRGDMLITKNRLIVIKSSTPNLRFLL